MPYKNQERRKVYQKTYGKTYYESNRERIKARAKARYKQNRVKCLAKLKAYRSENRDKIKDQQLQCRYGISQAVFNTLADGQGFLCAICRDVLEDSTGKGRTLAVDHSHRTGWVRGLLCENCNRGLGLFADNPNRLETAAAYIRFHNREGKLIME